jgi:aryl-alcohol dehydrogenase-like predicted oxidoreductase
MKYRRLGRTQLELSVIGFGAWGIGGSSWIGAQDEASIAALKAARDLGINFFDSALVYGVGHSERLLAHTFGTSREITVASKIPPKNRKWPMPFGTPLAEAFTRSHVEDCLLQSLKNLRREQIDLLQFHVWLDDWADNPEWLETVLWLRRSGMVRFVGISVNDHQSENVLRALRTGLIDTVQVIYNIFEQSPEDGLFGYCMQHGIGVIARVPFDEGGLTGTVGPQSTFPEKDFRNSYFGGARKTAVWRRVQTIARDMEIAVDAMPALALQFCLAHEAVGTVIPGMRKVEHVKSNAAAADAISLTKAQLALLKKHRWVRNFYAPPLTLSSRIKREFDRFGSRDLHRAVNR